MGMRLGGVFSSLMEPTLSISAILVCLRVSFSSAADIFAYAHSTSIFFCFEMLSLTLSCDYPRMMMNCHLKTCYRTMTSIVPTSYHPVLLSF